MELVCCVRFDVISFAVYFIDYISVLPSRLTILKVIIIRSSIPINSIGTSIYYFQLSFTPQSMVALFSGAMYNRTGVVCFPYSRSSLSAC